LAALRSGSASLRGFIPAESYGVKIEKAGVGSRASPGSPGRELGGERVGSMRRAQIVFLAALLGLAMSATTGPAAQAQVEKVAAKAKGEL